VRPRSTRRAETRATRTHHGGAARSHSLLRELLVNDDSLVQQAKVNSAKQFVESPDFDDAVTGAVADNQGAHEKMSDYFFTNAPGRSHLISDIAKWFYQVVSSETANT
jgi:type I restriction enzyme R subunit